VQAKQLAYHDRDRWLADPRHAQVPTARLVSKAYADERRKLIDSTRASAWDQVPESSLGGRHGVCRAVDARATPRRSSSASTASSAPASPTRHRRGAAEPQRVFLARSGAPESRGARQGTVHTLIASLAFKGEKLWAALGCMGADGQPQIHLQAYVAMIDYSRDIQEAVAAPRWLSGRFALGEARDTLHIEARFPRETIEELARRGHRLDRWGDWNELAGHAHGITIDPQSGMRAGGYDPRSDGAAVGY